MLEFYRYAPGPAEELPKHSHEEYQFCLSLDFPGEYRYRGERRAVPVGSLSVIHPGEVHSARDPHERRAPATYRVMYAGSALLREVAGKDGEPFFPEPIILDAELAGLFLAFHVASENNAPGLEQDSQLLSVLARCVGRYSDARSRRPETGRERRAVKLAREYLEDNLAENVSLEKLSILAGLSRFHLSRVFHEEVGLPPHAYQNQVRLSRAKNLLLGGRPASLVAREVGFADQSHFTRHFRRRFGAPPGVYARNSKNVQDWDGRA